MMAKAPAMGTGGIEEGTTSLRGGTLTFLLTDVEGSSRLWERDPDAAREALRHQQEIIGDSVERYGGTMPLEQGEGDSSVSVFVRASDAARCALDIQRALAEKAWPAGAEVRVRMAVHTGEAEREADGTYRGAALNRCARLRAIAHGGQILVSHAAYEVLVDGLADAALRDLGVHRLRDLERPEHVWQLCRPDLRETFPPLRSIDAIANNVPLPVTSFVGREREIAALARLLGEHRLVALTGAGGCGKTRLAVQVAARVADDYPDGVWWVDLAPLADASLVPAALAAVLGVRESPVEALTETVAAHLSARRALVVLDNCEHLIDACADLATHLLSACPAVTLVATSRELLGVEGEATFRVPPLSLPGANGAARSEESESVRLFVDRARAVQPGFVLDDEAGPVVAEIARRLDGIPLALELAAARVRLLTVEEIAAGLADRFHLLTGGARSSLPRQRTLEGSVGWSHDLLDGAERAVFRRLAVFAGSFTLDAAQTVCAGEGVAPGDVLDMLTALVDRSLVQVVEKSGAQARYRLLETIRDYARHRLVEAGEADAVHDRHLEDAVAFAEMAAEGLEGADVVAWLSRVDAELDNIRAALDWSPRAADPEGGVRIVARLILYWFARSDLGIARTRLEATVRAGRAQDRDRALALATLCMVFYRTGEMEIAAGYGDEGVVLARQLGDGPALGRALHCRAWVRYWGESDRFAAWADFEEAAELLETAGDEVFASLNLALLAWSLSDTKESSRARDAVTRAPALSATSGALHARSYCLMVLGYFDTLEGHLDRAATQLEEAVRLADSIGDPYVEMLTRMFSAFCELARGRYDAGRAVAEQGLARAREHRSPTGEGISRLTIGNLRFAEGDLDAAEAELHASLDLLGPLMPLVAAFSRVVLARVALARGAFTDAAAHADAVLAVALDTDNVFATIGALTVQASVARHEGDSHRAEDILHRALDLAHPHHRPLVCDLLDHLGGAVADQGRQDEAARLLGASQSLRGAIGYVRPPIAATSHEAEVAAVRASLGAAAFAEAYGGGGTVSFDEAVAYARRGRGQRKRPTHGWGSLTPTERQVVDLVVEGLTNPQIGERMFISKRTVQTHLAHVFSKLNVSTRAELAARAAQRQGPEP